MTTVTVVIKAKHAEELHSLLKSLDTVIKANDWNTCFEHSVDFVTSEGEASIVMIQDKEAYNGVKINCCE
jgi:hypothetical protein